MDKKIFYNSSMPRSGSTILQNIMGQNPDFYVTPTSGLVNMVLAARESYSVSPEFKAVDRSITQKPFFEFCKQGMLAYNDAITQKPYTLDKSRAWGINAPLLTDIFGEKPKIIGIVRDLRDVFASMEKKFRKSTAMGGGLPALQNSTLEQRIEHWTNTAPVGTALNWFNDILVRKMNVDFKFIRYEDLLNDPQSAINSVYDYLEVERYAHDFDNIKQITHENDEMHGIFGDHKIKEGPLVPYKPQFTDVLTPDTVKFIETKYAWYFAQFHYNLVSNKE